MSDFYIQAAAQRATEIEADRSQALADLQQAKRYGDSASAAQAVQTIANLDSEYRNLHDLHARYVASQTPVQQPEPTRDELVARPWDKLSQADMLTFANDSKYAAGTLSVDDPNVRAGLAEVHARRQRGQ